MRRFCSVIYPYFSSYIHKRQLYHRASFFIESRNYPTKYPHLSNYFSKETNDLKAIAVSFHAQVLNVTQRDVKRWANITAFGEYKLLQQWTQSKHCPYVTWATQGVLKQGSQTCGTKATCGPWVLVVGLSYWPYSSSRIWPPSVSNSCFIRFFYNPTD